MNIVRHLAVAAIILLVLLNAGEHAMQDFLPTLAAWAGWDMDDVQLAEKLVGMGASAGSIIAIRFNVWQFVQKWMSALGFDSPNE